MSKEYYAHTSFDGRLEPDYEHAVRAMKLAQQFSAHICDPNGMGFTALVHDAAGKHTARFQDVLFRHESFINHAWSSASVILNEYRSMFSNDETALMVYNMIRGHHNGLSSEYLFDPLAIDDVITNEALKSKSNFDFTVDDKRNAFSSEAEYQNAVQFVCDLINQYCQCVQRIDFVPNEGWKNIEDKMLHIRMLMSCLVDADYSATASFEEPKYGAFMDGEKLDAEKMLQKLDQYRTNLVATAGDSPMNELRNIVYHDSAKAGQNFDPKFFQLTAPTGTAKTLALIKFALESAKRNGQSRIILVVPYLTITEQTTAIYKAIFGDDIVLEDDSSADLDKDAYIQAERWSAPVIVTTNVKFYETLFSNKPSVLRKLHHIANAVVMFDESQSLDPAMADITITTLMQLPKYGTSVVLSTATPPAYEYRKHIDYNYQEIIENVANLYKKYSDVKKDVIHFSTEPMTFEQIVEPHKDCSQILYVVNTTGKALELYNVLRKATDCILLYSRMCGNHKRKIVNEIKSRLQQGLPCTVVSTQCIEAGVDLDFPVVCREWAPLTSIIQTFGRLNRNGRHDGVGYVFKTKQHDVYHFPGASYLNNTATTIWLYKKYGDTFDVKSLDIQREYFKNIFTTTNAKDDKDLKDALKICDFGGIAKHYRVIDASGGLNVIVPYAESIALYDEIQNAFEENGFVITKSLMRKAHPITVMVYGNSSLGKRVLSGCSELFYRNNGELYPSEWRVLSSSAEMYDSVIGLNDGEEGGLIL